VQAHGGAISVEPNPDRGVTFRFELPLEVSDGASVGAGAPPEEATLKASTQGAVREPTVCVVDDDPAVRESLVRLLTAAGRRVASYASASEFLARPSFLDVGCVLLDIQMPGMSGLELQEHLASTGAAPPIVFVTGRDDDVTAGVEAMKLGAVDFLLKPVNGDVLLAVVRKALEHHAGERKLAFEREACQALVGRLTAREREIMEHVIRGRLNKQIAADLDIAEQTVKQHRGRVMEKLEVRSLAELIRVCEASGLFASRVRPASKLAA